MKNERLKLILINIACVIICFAFGSFFTYQLINTSMSDSAYTGPSQDGGAIALNHDDYVQKALEDIYLSRKPEILVEDIENIMNDSSIPDGLKQYFSDFIDFYVPVFSEVNPKLLTTLSTESFIKSAVIIKKYYEKDSMEDKLTKASIIPYYFIKNYNAKNESQKDQKALYKLYIDNFVTGRTSLDSPAANVICLYVYACYEARSSDTDLHNLKVEIENFLKEYKNDLGENGDMKIQSNYLVEAQEVIQETPNIGNLFQRGWWGIQRSFGYRKDLKPFTDF